ncbi:MAG: DUF1254 domain-containing protein [Mycobacterium sp.]|nr:DUF1254 domain-containing protein [Mycobacterium sp.]
MTAGTAAVGTAAPTAPGTVASRPVRVSKRASAPGGRTAADSAQPAASDAGTPQPVASSPQATPSTAAPVAAAVTAADPGPIQSAILAAQAYIYGYPLMEYQRVRQTVETVNALYSLTSFADPDVDPIWLAIGGGKRPNVDTFYSLAELDLSNGPVVLSIPDMGDRYFSFQLTDPYTNVSGYIGSRTTGSGPGDYAITWTGGPQVDIPGAQTIPVPYASMLALGRTLAGDEADQQAAIALIKQYALDPAGGAVSPVIPIPEPGIGYLDAISAAMALSPPPAIDAPTLEALARIGVGPGMTVADANLSMLSTITADLAVRVTAALLPVLTTINQYVSAFQGGGWATPPANIGNYGTDYLLRAGVAEVGLVANTPEEAVYSAGLLGANRFPLSGFGTGSYVMHFAPGEEPPVGAFWSVTVYNGQGRLVPNSQNRYAVSSSRPDELIRRPDGSIDIVFAPRDPGDPGANWLKVPAGAGFSAYLRMYMPDQSVLDGTWVAPPIERRWSLF